MATAPAYIRSASETDAYVDFTEDESGNLVDIDFYCTSCAPDTVKEGLYWPAYEMPDYNVVCKGCTTVIHRHKGDWEELA